MENYQIKAPPNEISEEISDEYSPLRKISRKRQQSDEYKNGYDSDTLEEHFQASESKYQPSSDDEEPECSFNYENKGKRTKKNDN